MVAEEQADAIDDFGGCAQLFEIFDAFAQAVESLVELLQRDQAECLAPVVLRQCFHSIRMLRRGSGRN